MDWDKPKYCASHLTLSQYLSAAQLSKSGMSPKMDWHSQTNIISMVWNGVESFAETKTNDWSETNWKIVPHASRWANCMAKSAREWIFENWALIYIYTILWAVKGRLHCSSPPTRPCGGPPRGPPIVFFHCPEWPWSDFSIMAKLDKTKNAISIFLFFCRLLLESCCHLICLSLSFCWNVKSNHLPSSLACAKQHCIWRAAWCAPERRPSGWTSKIQIWGEGFFTL